MPPPKPTRHVSVDAPSATEDTLANTTSDIITMAVVCALKRAAPELHLHAFSPEEIKYVEHGGILQYVLRQLAE